MSHFKKFHRTKINEDQQLQLGPDRQAASLPSHLQSDTQPCLTERFAQRQKETVLKTLLKTDPPQAELVLKTTATVITQVIRSFIGLSALITLRMNSKWWSTRWTTWALTWSRIKQLWRAAARNKFSSRKLTVRWSVQVAYKSKP